MRSGVSLLGIAIVIVGCDGGDSSKTRIPSAQRCIDCRITIQEVARLGGSEPAAQALFPSSVVRIRDRYVMAPTLLPGTIGLFSENGRFEGAAGNLGSGPGEMRQVQGLIEWPGDSVAVVHDRNRISLYGSELEYHRSFSLQSASFLTNRPKRQPNGELLAPRNGTGGGEDYPLRLFTPEGEPSRGFGDQSQFGQGRIYTGVVAGRTRIWAVNGPTYEIDEYLLTGEKQATYQRTLSWFPAAGTTMPDGRSPMVIGIGHRGGDQVWILLLRPRPHSNPQHRASEETIEAAAPMHPGVGDMAEMFEYVLEFLDLNRRAVLVRASLEHRVVSGFLDGDHMYGYAEDPQTGALTMVIWRLGIEDGSN